MLDIHKFKNEYEELSVKLADLSKIDSRELGGLFSRQSALQEIMNVYDAIVLLQKKIDEAQEVIDSGDAELSEMARMELEELNSQLVARNSELELLIIPPDPNDEKNVIIEIRAGTGGEEAALFANDLFRMYTRFATLKNWKMELLSLADADAGGVKEVVAKISGKSVYKLLKYESGVHRVQRVPATEAAGRIHTSAASVVVMPEVDDIDVKINMNDLVIDVYRSGGNGGQSVNTTDSAVRITHKPSGLVVTCQDTKEQQKNKASALAVLRSRLYQIEVDKQNAEISSKRKDSIGSGDRSEKIKTYNFPQDRLTDHRVKLTWYGLDKILGGEIESILVQSFAELEKEKATI
jgi:peptide chain release factor 1